MGPPPTLSIKQSRFLDFDPEHLLQTDRLGTKLDPILIPLLRSSPFILHRDHLSLPVELDNVGHPRKPKSVGDNPHPSFHPHTRARGLVSHLVRFLVQNTPFRREPIFRPKLLHMNQGTLPLTKKQVLEPGQGEKFSGQIGVSETGMSENNKVGRFTS